MRITPYYLLVLMLSVESACAFSTVTSFIPSNNHNFLRKSANPNHVSYLLAVTSKQDSFDAQIDPSEVLGREKLQEYFDFPIDGWQAQAGGEILSGNNVIVCAPTGAGKTVVGEMALQHAFHSDPNGAAIYTTPLKALSNQKFAELRKIFGAANVGLSTGDMSINRGARIMVMTTEVYRNMAWRAMDSSNDDDQEHILLDDNLSQRGRNELSNVKVVVLDEFHYMGTKGRGGVWEESVITSPKHTQIVGLSATLPNADKLALWMEKVTNRKTTLVEAAGGRPVPLRYLFATRDGLEPMFRNEDAGPGAPLGLLGLRGDGFPEKKPKRKGKNKDLFEDDESIPKGLDLNPKLKSWLQKRSEKVNRMVARKAMRLERERDGRGDYGATRGRNKDQSTLSPREQRKEKERLLKKEMRQSVPSLHFLLRKLDQRDLLPAIFFLFSRAGCDEAAENVCYQMRKGAQVLSKSDISSDTYEGKSRRGRQRSARKKDALLKDTKGRSFRSNSNYIDEDTFSNIFDNVDFDASLEVENLLEESSLIDYAERGLLTFEKVKEVAALVAAFNEENDEIKFSDEQIDRFLHGVGSHHAAMIPHHKAFVERLFRNQLMKVIFATETLAAGLNMPARTTVICSLAKRGEGGAMNPLDTANTLQMAGRAGRRGMDTDGTCVLVTTPFEGPEEAIDILISEINPVESQFSPGYSLAVNLIARGEGKLDVAKTLVQKSFSQWTKQQVESQVQNAKEIHGEEFDEMVEIAAHEKFLDGLKASLDKSRHKRMIDVLEDKALLKKASKSFTGVLQILNLEESTLSYLQKELEQMSNIESVMDEDGLSSLLSEDNKNIEEEIARQKQRIRKSREDVSKHIMTALAVEANSILTIGSSPFAVEMQSALFIARKSDKEVKMKDKITPLELTRFAKSAVTMNRKRRKQKSATKDSGIDGSSLIDVLNVVDEVDDSLDDLLALVNVLVAFGCIRTIDDSEVVDVERQSFRITTGGENVGLLGLDNALWFLTAMGGAWDVTGASAELDKFKTEMNNIGVYDENSLLDDDAFDIEDDYGLFEKPTSSQESSSREEEKDESDVISLPQREANILTEQLLSLTPAEIAGYVSCLVSEGGRRDGNASVLSAFQQLTPSQQRVVQSSLLAVERLTEVQNKFSVDESTSKVTLELATCEVVTAWTEGCSWNEALEISGQAPGDLIRTLHRALDALRQIGNLPVNAVRALDAGNGIIQKEAPGIHPDIRRMCREAAISMDRFPVKDPLQFEDEDEDEDEGIDGETEKDADEQNENTEK